jgi:hypothetical protein
LEADNSPPDIALSVGDPDELRILTHAACPNALLIGPDDMAGAFVALLLPRLQPPFSHCERSFAAAICGFERGTLVIWSVERLDASEQRHLLAFLDRQRGVQILSVAGTSLFEHVQRGAFLEELYYRLNTVLIDVTAVLSEARS